MRQEGATRIMFTPTTVRSPINVNSLTPGDPPLLVMLTGGSLSLPASRVVIAARPAGGWPDPARFWRQPALNGLPAEPDARDQVTVRKDCFAVRTALIEPRPGGEARTVIRRWTLEDQVGDRGFWLWGSRLTARQDWC